MREIYHDLIGKKIWTWIASETESKELDEDVSTVVDIVLMGGVPFILCDNGIYVNINRLEVFAIRDGGTPP